MSHPQHMAALAEANRIRFARADLKRDIRTGLVTLAEAFEHPDVGSMPALNLLKAQWRWGDMRARRTMRYLMMSEGRAVCSLTDRQKRALVQACEGMGRAA